MTQPVPFMSRIVSIVAFAGLAPFAAGLLFTLAPDLAPLNMVIIERSLVGFGAVILSFLGGVRWGLRLQGGAGDDLTFIMGMLGALGGLIMLLIPYPFALIVLAVGFALQGFWDARSGGVPTHYASLRGIMTWLVCVLIIAILVARMVVGT